MTASEFLEYLKIFKVPTNVTPGTGTVTSITFNAPLTGGTINTSGNVGVQTDPTFPGNVTATGSITATGASTITGTLTGAYSPTRTQGDAGDPNLTGQLTTDANGTVYFINTTPLTFVLLFSFSGNVTPGFTTTLVLSDASVTIGLIGSDTLIAPAGDTISGNGTVARVRLISNGVWSLEIVSMGLNVNSQFTLTGLGSSFPSLFLADNPVFVGFTSQDGLNLATSASAPGTPSSGIKIYTLLNGSVSEPFYIDEAGTQHALAGSSSGGTVTSFTGVADRIVVTPDPLVTTGIVDIASTYAGQASITTLGTIATGTWNADIIGLSYGGSGAALTASNGALVYTNATEMALIAPPGTANHLLTSQATGAPVWSTVTYPATISAHSILSTAIDNVLQATTASNNTVLIAGGTSAISFSASLPTQVQGNITQLGIVQTGTWSATAIGITHGGTGLTTTPGANAVLIGDTNAYALKTLTAGTGITFDVTSNTFTINASAGTVTSISGVAGQIVTDPNPITGSGTVGLATNPVVPGLTASQAVVTDSAGALHSLAYSQSSTASSLAQRDSSSRLYAANYLAGAGTAAAPGYSFSSYTNCGFYAVSANDVRLSLAGALALQFTTANITTHADILPSALQNLGNPGAHWGSLYVEMANVNSLLASRVVVSSTTKSLASSSVTTTELGYVSGVTSAIQSQLNTKINLTDATYSDGKLLIGRSSDTSLRLGSLIGIGDISVAYNAGNLEISTTAGGVKQVLGLPGEIVIGGTSAYPIVGLDDTSVIPGVYAFMQAGVDSMGRITNAISLGYNNSAANNLFVGSNAGTAYTTGSNNSIVGLNTMQALSSASGVTICGTAIANSVTTATNFTAIGYNISSANNLTNSGAFGYGASVLVSNAYAYGNSAASHGFGTGTPLAKVDVRGTFRYQDTTITYGPSGVLSAQSEVRIVSAAVETIASIPLPTTDEASAGSTTRAIIEFIAVTDVAGTGGVGGKVEIEALYDGATSNIVGTPEIIINTRGSLSGATVTAGVSGNNIIVQAGNGSSVINSIWVTAYKYFSVATGSY